MGASAAVTTGPGTGTFRHEAAFYDGLDSFVDVLVPFVRQGLEAGEPVLVAELPRQTRVLREELGGDADDVTFLAMAEAGRNPACIIPVWREFVLRHPGRSVRGIGEPAWSGRRDVELEECRLHEALLNVAFDDAATFRLLCPYDVGALPSEVVTGAMRTHPELGAGARHAPYEGHDHAREVFARALPAPPRRAQEVGFGAADLASLRSVVRFFGEGARLTPELVDDLVLAVHELACNSIEHGGGRGVLRGWSDSNSLVLEVADGGVILDPLIGREQVVDLAEGGRGIWMANHLCDLVQVRSGDDGTSVRLHTWT
ncbi:MAG: sensor histidine kinase [Nocardioidaceae bacterium]